MRLLTNQLTVWIFQRPSSTSLGGMEFRTLNSKAAQPAYLFKILYNKKGRKETYAQPVEKT